MARETYYERNERLVKENGLDVFAESYAEKKKEIEKIMEEARKEAQKVLQEGAEFIFNKFPAIQSFGWHQFTPYFNDGDECIFRVDADYDYGIKINNKTLDEFEVPEGLTKEENKKAQDKTNEIYQVVGAFIGLFDDDDMKAMFGDHVEITVTRNGISTDDYSDHR